MHSLFSLGFSGRFVYVLCTPPPPNLLFYMVLFMCFEVYLSLLTVWEEFKALETSVSKIVFIKGVLWGGFFFLKSLIYIFPLLLGPVGAVALCCFSGTCLDITQRELVGYFLLAWLTLRCLVGGKDWVIESHRILENGSLRHFWKYQQHEISLNRGAVICRAFRLEDTCRLNRINFSLFSCHFKYSYCPCFYW